jgi:hypothetical protein
MLRSSPGSWSNFDEVFILRADSRSKQANIMLQILYRQDFAKGGRRKRCFVAFKYNAVHLAVLRFLASDFLLYDPFTM